MLLASDKASQNSIQCEVMSKISNEDFLRKAFGVISLEMSTLLLLLPLLNCKLGALAVMSWNNAL